MKYKPKAKAAHKWVQISRKVTYPYCVKCGLIHLRNDVSRKFAKASCDVGDDDHKILIPGLKEYRG